MRNPIILFLCLVVTTLPAQFSLQVEQGISISDDIHYNPIGIGLTYQATKMEGFNFSFGLAFDRVTLEEELVVNPNVTICGIADCLPVYSFAKSYESRLLLPFGISRTVKRFTFGLQIRPGFRIHDRVETQRPRLSFVHQTEFGENIPYDQLISDNVDYRIEKSRFSLQLGTDFRYAVSKRISFGLNYRYEGFIDNSIRISQVSAFGVMTREFEFLRGEAQAHYLVAAVSLAL